jgi:hypothetical protein
MPDKVQVYVGTGSKCYKNPLMCILRLEAFQTGPKLTPFSSGFCPGRRHHLLRPRVQPDQQHQHQRRPLLDRHEPDFYHIQHSFKRKDISLHSSYKFEIILPEILRRLCYWAELCSVDIFGTFSFSNLPM